MPLVKRTPVALEIDCRGLTNRVCSDEVCPARCTKTLKNKPTDYLKQLSYDSMVFTPEGLRHLVAEVGASQLVWGTDNPLPWTTTAVDHIRTTPGLSDAERVVIRGETAATLLAIEPTSITAHPLRRPSRSLLPLTLRRESA